MSCHSPHSQYNMLFRLHDSNCLHAFKPRLFAAKVGYKKEDDVCLSSRKGQQIKDPNLRKIPQISSKLVKGAHSSIKNLFLLNTKSK